MAGGARRRQVRPLQGKRRLLVVAPEVVLGRVPLGLRVAPVARAAPGGSDEFAVVPVYVAGQTAVRDRAWIGLSLGTESVFDAENVCRAGRRPVTRGALGPGVRPFEQESAVVIEAAAQRILAHPVPPRRDVMAVPAIPYPCPTRPEGLRIS